MKAPTAEVKEILNEVFKAIKSVSVETDSHLLSIWRVTYLCQITAISDDPSIVESCLNSLRCFCSSGLTSQFNADLQITLAGIRHQLNEQNSFGPFLNRGRAKEALGILERLSASSSISTEKALTKLPYIFSRVSSATEKLPLFGLEHRLTVAHSVLTSASYSDEQKLLVASAIYYFDEEEDAINDSLCVVGLLDDDFVLQSCLSKAGVDRAIYLHWAEHILSLWEDVPFLVGMNLIDGKEELRTTWLDRANAYVAYKHAISEELSPLLLLQPSTAISPVYTLMALAGVGVLDSVTSYKDMVSTLELHATYTLDGHVVEYDGSMEDGQAAGWLKLKFKDGHCYAPPSLGLRMAKSSLKKLSESRKFSSGRIGKDPVQEFFGWPDPIFSSFIEKKVILVATRQRAEGLFGNLTSNGVSPLASGIVRLSPTETDASTNFDGSLIVVAHSLEAARNLLESGINPIAVFVDGYEHLNRGHHALPFISRQRSPIILWSPSGYFPLRPPAWLTDFKKVETSADEILEMILFEERLSGNVAQLTSLTEHSHLRHVVASTSSENLIVEKLDELIDSLSQNQVLPGYLVFFLLSKIKAVKSLVVNTPSDWQSVRTKFSELVGSVGEKMSKSRSAGNLVAIKAGLSELYEFVKSLPDGLNSKGIGLKEFIKESQSTHGWTIACTDRSQANATEDFVQSQNLTNVSVQITGELPEFSNVIVTSWPGLRQARRVFSHSPKTIATVGAETENEKWNRLLRLPYATCGGQSILSATGFSGLPSAPAVPDIDEPEVEEMRFETPTGISNHPSIPCTLLWLTTEDRVKILPRDSRVYIETGGQLKAMGASKIAGGCRVVLSPDSDRWSPSDEFTEAVVSSVRQSRPDLVEKAKDWRLALHSFMRSNGLSSTVLSSKLDRIGISREIETVERWLDISSATPIAPQSTRRDLELLWPLIKPFAKYSLDEIEAACTHLRQVRRSSGQLLVAIWNNQAPPSGFGDPTLEAIVARLQRHVGLFEVSHVELAEVPEPLMGWWVPAALARHYLMIEPAGELN